MPFELGLAVAREKSNPTKHTWFVLESKAYRIQKSLSDLNGTDPQIHGGQVSGVMRELSNIFRRPANQPTVPEMMSTFNAISRRWAKILAEAGTTSLFEAKAFQDLCYEAKVAAESLRLLK
jgi:nitroreductase